MLVMYDKTPAIFDSCDKEVNILGKYWIKLIDIESQGGHSLKLC